MQTLKLHWRDITGSPSGRIMLALILFTLVISGGFIGYTYQTQITSYQETEFSKLNAIANTLALQIDGNAYESLGNTFSGKDDIKSNQDDPFYSKISALLHSARVENKVNSDIYTLFKDNRELFSFGISSAENPYFRHSWVHTHPLYHLQYDQGGQLGPYEDENGTWLSAFAPIRNSTNKTVGLIQVDQHFDEFKARANAKIGRQILIIIPILLLLIYAMLHVVQRMLVISEKVKLVLTRQRNEIEFKNQEIMSSITRAKTIQDALLPQISDIQKIFPEMFVMFRPRDIVSGDFFWFTEKDDSVFFAVADCTGHGVPGGFMSMIGHTTLNDVVHYMGARTPSEILTKLDEQLTSKLYESEHRNTDGMDIALIKYCTRTQSIEFSGAMRPLMVVSAGEISIIRGSKATIGGHPGRHKQFENHIISVQPGDNIYLYSDGYSDQFGGHSNRKYMSKRFIEFLDFAQEHDMNDQHCLLRYEFNLWRNDEDQIDDILIAGIKIPMAA